MEQRAFYIELGKLFYAIATADANLHLLENRKLRDILKNDFKGIADQADDSGRTNFDYAEKEIEWLEENYVNPKIAFASFVTFIKQHANEIDEDMKETVLSSSRKVAGAFQGINRYEEHFLGRLEAALQKINRNE